jgi:hypothetical protein
MANGVSVLLKQRNKRQRWSPSVTSCFGPTPLHLHHRLNYSSIVDKLDQAGVDQDGALSRVVAMDFAGGGAMDSPCKGTSLVKHTS